MPVQGWNERLGHRLPAVQQQEDLFEQIKTQADEMLARRFHGSGKRFTTGLIDKVPKSVALKGDTRAIQWNGSFRTLKDEARLSTGDPDLPICIPVEGGGAVTKDQ